MENTHVSASGCAFYSFLYVTLLFLGLNFLIVIRAVSASRTFFMLAVFKDESMS